MAKKLKTGDKITIKKSEWHGLFSDMSKKEQNLHIEVDYNDLLLTIVTAMFRYKIITEGFKKFKRQLKFLELYLSIDGKAALFLIDNRLIVAQCDFVGEPDENGIGRDLIAVTKNGNDYEFKEWQDNDNVVVIFNNLYQCSDFIIPATASLLKNADISLFANMNATRHTSIIAVEDEKDKKNVEAAIEANNLGIPQAVVAKSKLLEDINNDLKILQLTDMKNSDKLQYLSKLRDDLMRFFYNVYGMSTYGTAKMAQQNSDEINSGLCASFIIPESRLEARRDGLQELKEKFGIEITCDFSLCWEYSFDRIVALAAADGDIAISDIKEEKQNEEQIEDQETEQEGEVEQSAETDPVDTDPRNNDNGDNSDGSGEDQQTEHETEEGTETEETEGTPELGQEVNIEININNGEEDDEHEGISVDNGEESEPSDN